MVRAVSDDVDRLLFFRTLLLTVAAVRLLLSLIFLDGHAMVVDLCNIASWAAERYLCRVLYSYCFY